MELKSILQIKKDRWRVEKMFYVTIGTLLAVIMVQFCLIISEKKDSWNREKDLLNRIMAKDYETFARVEIAKNDVDSVTKLTPEEYLQRYGEEGIPVI